MYINKLALALWKDPERRLAEVAKLRAVVDLLLAEREALHKGLKQMREEEIQRDLAKP
jgi:hypothetical protein